MRILVVEDHAVMARVTKRALEDLGHTVTVETDPARVREAAAEARPDVALADVQMPPFERFHAITELSGLDAAERPAIVAISGHSDPAVAGEALRRGADAFLQKPWDADDLAATVERLAAQ